MTTSNILDNEDQETIDAALAEIEARQEDIIRAKEAGINVDHQEARMIAARDQLRKIRQAFFPNVGI